MRKLGLFGLFGILLVAVALGCTSTYLGISPDPNKIHYPIGLVAHPNGRYLYVANSNFDLAYTGGTLMVFDTLNEDKTQVFDINGIKTKLKTLSIFPKATVEIGSFVGHTLLNLTADRLYLAIRQDRALGSYTACQKNEDCPVIGEECRMTRCRSTQTVESSSLLSVKLNLENTEAGHFACDNKPFPCITENGKKTCSESGGVGNEANFSVEPAPRCGDHAKIFFPDNAVPYHLALVGYCVEKRTCQRDVDCACKPEDSTKGICREGERCDAGRCVFGCRLNTDCKTSEICEYGRCVVDSSQGKDCTRDVDCASGERCDRKKCVPGCLVDRDCASGEFCQQGRCFYPRPMAAVFCTHSSDCAGWERCVEQHAIVSHLGENVVSQINLPTGGWESLSSEKRHALRTVSSLRVVENVTHPQGFTSVAVLPTTSALGDGGEIFLSSRLSHLIYILPPSLQIESEWDLLRVPFTNQDQLTRTGDLRGITIARDRKTNTVRLLVANRRPASLLVYTLERDPITQDIRANLVNSLPVGNDPAQILYRHRSAPDSDLIYVVCSRDRRIDVIDVDSWQTIHQIKVGQQPYFMSIYEPSTPSDPQRRRAYVANFLDTSIHVIDLDTHQVIGLIRGIDTILRTP